MAVPSGATEKQAAYIRDLYARHADFTGLAERNLRELLSDEFERTAQYKAARARGATVRERDALADKWVAKQLPKLKREITRRTRESVAKMTPSKAIDYLKNDGAWGEGRSIIRSWRG